MTVKIEDIREGDEVLIAFRVARVDTSTAWPHVEVDKFNLDGGIVSDEYLSAGVYAIAQHIPRKIEVGDRVQHKVSGLHYEVVAGPRSTAAGDVEVAVWRIEGGFWHYEVSDLERVS